MLKNIHTYREREKFTKQLITHLMITVAKIRMTHTSGQEKNLPLTV